MSNNPKTINTLLDIEMFTGEGKGRIGPILVFLLVSGVPAIIYVRYLILILPFTLALLFQICWIIVWALIIPGEQKKRVDQFRRLLYDIYSSVYSLMRIKPIHDDGCIEYIDNRVSYLVVASNGSSIDPVMRAKVVSRFISNIGSEYVPDIYVQNIDTSDELWSRYSSVKFFTDDEVAKDFLDIIDNIIKIVKEESLVTRTIFQFKARKSEWKELRKAIESAVRGADSQVFKYLIIADKKLVEDILSRDMDAYIDFEEMGRKKYMKGNYFGSRVIGYDIDFGEEQTVISEERGFMIHE
jgi:hypothetical protein